MILQSLHQLYNRLAEDPQNGLPTPGYSLQNISFCVIIKADGSLIEIVPCRTETIEIGKNGKEKKTVRPLSLLVPGQSKPPGQGLNPCFLWDNTGYMLGFKPEDPKKSEAAREKERIRTLASFDAFKTRHLETETLIADPHFSSVCRFLESWSPDQAADHPMLQEIISGFGVFQISGSLKYVHQAPAVSRWWNEQNTISSAGETSFCLVTGKPAPTAATHDPAIKSVAGAQSSGAKLVSFNLKSVESFSKEQGDNSPVSETAAFAYCNALNWLLARKERRFRIGDATTVFWTAAATTAETLFPWMMSGVPEAEDTATKNRVHDLLKKISQGILGRDDLGDPTVPYYILGLSPNASRLSVRFWHTGELGELITKLKLHLQQLSLVRQWDETNSKNPEPVTPTVYQLLRQTSRDADGIPPLLGGALMRAIVLGTPYPDSLITAVINRIRAEREVSYLKVAVLKAWLIRNHHQLITPMLDETNVNLGYRLGRLFAALEKTQQDALPDLNATIRERFYSSASATPRAVFGRLLRLYPHHLGKLPIGGKIVREKLVQEILDSVQDFPSHLNLQGQAQFALGYYHQRKAFYPTKTKEATVA
ncbi:type I-C CRISPR-associated protein Cas8c/Csd1 [Synoicihabitans lomoniglobus]|uniref:Type I-C CRISPR-associated protein Cas8c/Csd1 n=1 Tax=Synoicihabitans lomoniglobus TaxID=2909285 RepID=A0AAE9ZXI9_9BACT|nr:type I-C CRISPR-associated protein Cas8c/Csd1 [Opitutaceae bacterium LMO-M01]WED64750.1 type I-C CRISPR-associated protein Cas8c/Csd1 [Opitutaceae bacterium LMO-M01]